MKKIITTVGTSLFENYHKKYRDTAFESAYNFFKNKEISAKELDNLDNQELSKKSLIDKFNSNYFKNNFDASAEIKSLIKLQEELKEDFDIYLLHSDTALGRLAAEIIKDNISLYEEYGLKISRVDIHPIENLQIQNRQKFIQGMQELINKIYKISQNYWGNVVINITGGYKATIPYLTILAQVNQCPIYYIFENTDTLIQIPNIPIDINWKLFEDYWKSFSLIEKLNGIKESDLPEKFLKDCRAFLESVDIDNEHYCVLNPLGEILWNKYKEKYFVFYTTDDIYEKINHKEIQRIFKSKFSNPQIRGSKTQIKNNHYVYDDGNNPYRIFYFEEKDVIYVYEVFANHDDYSKYLNDTLIDQKFKQEFMNNSKCRKYPKEVQ
jgi:putative CRISPR-associated protein (TIGR02619 family)